MGICNCPGCLAIMNKGYDKKRLVEQCHKQASQAHKQSMSLSPIPPGQEHIKHCKTSAGGGWSSEMQKGMQRRDKTKPGLKNQKNREEINPQALQTWSKILSPLRDQSPKVVTQHCPIHTSQEQILYSSLGHTSHIKRKKNQQLGQLFFLAATKICLLLEKEMLSQCHTSE